MEIWRLIAHRWTIYGACDSRGICIFQAWLEGLDPSLTKDRDRLLATLERSAQDPAGPRSLPIETSHQIEGDIYQISKGQLRVLYFYDKQRVIICTHGFFKKSGKTPPQEITRATTIRDDYFAALNKGAILRRGDDYD